MKAIAQAQAFRQEVNPPALSVLYGIILAVVFALVLAPVLFIAVYSFQLASPGQEPVWGISAWKNTLAKADVWLTMWNSIRLYLATSMVSWPTAILLAWIIGRTDIPKAHWIEFFF